MARLVFRKARPEDIDPIVADLRPADLDEADALFGPGQAAKAIRDSLRGSVMAWTAEDSEGPVFIFGVSLVSMLGEEGQPWMVGTTRTERYPRELVIRGRQYSALMLKVAPLLANVVDARNTRAIAWLKHIGFAMLPARPLGAAGLPFHPFYMDA